MPKTNSTRGTTPSLNEDQRERGRPRSEPRASSSREPIATTPTHAGVDEPPTVAPGAEALRREEAAHATTVDRMARQNVELARQTRRGPIGPVGRIVLLFSAMALVVLALGWVILAAITT